MKENIRLAPYTTLGIGGTAEYFAAVSTTAEILVALNFAHENQLPVFVLGGGSNILISDSGVNGLVIKIELMGTKIVKDTAKKQVLRVGAGEVWDDFVRYCVKNELWGVECLSGIPGSVGASPIQNIGAYGQEVKNVIVEVETIDRTTLAEKKFTHAECAFTYRSSHFKQTKNELITHVTFNLLKNATPKLDHAGLKNHFSTLPANSHPSLLEIREKVLKARAQKAMLYSKSEVNSHSTGSFFVHPIIDRSEFTKLYKKYPTMPFWEVSSDFVKLPAGWLIENAGFNRGYRYKTTGISDKHALALVNRGHSTAQDVFELSEIIRTKVNEVFGITLERESQLVGEF